MTEHKITDDEVIKALECCTKAVSLGDCQDLGCPCLCKQGCYFYLRTDEDYENTIYIELLKEALDLINRQKAEIAALTSAVDNSTKEFLKLHDTYQDQKAEIERFADIGKMYSEIKAEAIKEFAERLKSELEAMQRVSDGKVVFSVSVERIESVVKERLEGG